jgi:hypothetical protein
MRLRTFATRAAFAGLAVATPCMLFALWMVSSGRTMAPLLPPAVEGQSTCFAGTFVGQALDLEDWSKTQLVALDRLAPDGKPYMRPVPRELKDKPVHGFVLQLIHDDRKSDYDWIYNFRLAAEVEGVGTLFAAGECPWFAGSPILAPRSGIYCYIDCDGGGFNVDRVPGAQALYVSFESYGLRMKAGCGGGGSYRVKAGTPGAVFRLKQASAATCQPLEQMANR